MNKYRIVFFLLIPLTMAFSSYSCKIAVLKYNGGGDWYANPTALPNLIAFCNENIGTEIKKEPATVAVGSSDIFNYPFVHMTGHGNVVFSSNDVENLRKYLLAGGFLHVDDNYGMDPYVRSELNKLFPENNLIELSNNHPIFNGKYKFKDGLPKIHEHDNKPPQAFGIFEKETLVVLYTYETDLGDGWEDEAVHNNSWELREKSLKMGVNIIYFALTQ